VLGAVFDLDGAEHLEVVAWFKSRAAGVPIVLLVTAPSVELILWALRVGARDVLTKPVSPEESSAVIDEFAKLALLRNDGSQRREAVSRRLDQSPAPGTLQGERCPASATLARRIRNYVVQHISEPMRTEDIAAACGCSSARCCRALKQRCGETIQSYVLLERIRHAAVLLRSSNLPIGEIAWRTGFRDTAYFSKTFRRLLGRTPREYRSDAGEVPVLKDPFDQRNGGAAHAATRGRAQELDRTG
jgi:AraC-like DNA-binding protein